MDISECQPLPLYDTLSVSFSSVNSLSPTPPHNQQGGPWDPGRTVAVPHHIILIRVSTALPSEKEEMLLTFFSAPGLLQTGAELGLGVKSTVNFAEQETKACKPAMT